LDKWNTRTPPQVKPLVWTLVGDWDYKSDEYLIWLWQATDTPQPVWVIYFPDQTRATRRSLEDAKEAAQDHHERRILDAMA